MYDKDRKECERIEVRYNEEKYLIMVELTKSDDIKLEVTRSLDPFSWTEQTNLEKLTEKEKKWSLFEKSHDVYLFIIEQFKSGKAKFLMRTQSMQLVFPLEISKTVKFDLVIEVQENEADAKTMMNILCSNVRQHSEQFENHSQLMNSLKIIQEKQEQAFFNYEKRIATLEKLIYKVIDERKNLKKTKVFETSNGNCSLTPTNWTPMDIKGTADLIKGRVYEIKLMINSMATSTIWQMNFRINIKGKEENFNVPSDFGHQKYFSGVNNYINDLLVTEIFSVCDSGNFEIQAQVWNRSSGYTYLWNGAASLFIRQISLD